VTEDIKDISEEKLIQQAVKGNKRAFGRLYETYLDQIYRYVYYRVSDHQEAEDLTEMTFLKVWETIPKLKDQDVIRNFRAWIYRIAHNLVIDHYRKKKPEYQMDGHMDVPSADQTLETGFQEKEQGKHLKEAISQLEPTMQSVIIARFINQLSHAETAIALNLKEGHVRVLQYRALKKLRTLFVNEENENG
jgi:RNA polymerase sigma-70 factor (ECF subfamily)